jgi:hypothetical protein
MPSLEALYRGLLFTYPAGYRAEHEDEIVTTLLDAAPPGQSLPSVREVAGLITGGLRTQALAAARKGARTQWADGLRLGAVLLLACYTSLVLKNTFGMTGQLTYLYPTTIGLVLVLTVRGATPIALALLAAAAGWRYLLAGYYWADLGGLSLVVRGVEA